MKALKPSHREHKRYLLLSGKDATREIIEETILKFIGILGWAKASPEFVKLEEKKIKPNKIVLSVNRQELDKIKASFAISNKDIKIERVSGMINKL
jgi:RNase P/RNase MRP subunit POP5